MSQRPRRHTSSRSMVSQKRKPVATAEYSEDEKTTIALGKNWFFQQSPMSQVYYLKVVIGIGLGFFVGAFYNIGIIAGNWFIFPLIGLGSVILIARNYLKISKDDLDDLRLITWSGTISMIIAFIGASALTFNILFAQV